MSEREESSKRYDLEERTLQFARDVRAFVKELPRTVANDEDIRQLVRASGFGGGQLHRDKRLAEQEGLRDAHQDFSKGGEGSRYWLRLLDTVAKGPLEKTRTALIREATELMNIFGAIVRKSE